MHWLCWLQIILQCKRWKRPAVCKKRNFLSLPLAICHRSCYMFNNWTFRAHWGHRASARHRSAPFGASVFRPRQSGARCQYLTHGPQHVRLRSEKVRVFLSGNKPDCRSNRFFLFYIGTASLLQKLKTRLATLSGDKKSVLSLVGGQVPCRNWFEERCNDFLKNVIS